jgi:hypothetical protein
MIFSELENDTFGLKFKLSSCIVKSRVGYFAYSLDDVVASTCPVTVSFSSSENIMHAIRNYIFNVDHMKIADFRMMSPSNYYQMAPHFWLYYI